MNLADSSIDWAALEAAMHADPGARGLASFRRDGLPLDAGQLQQAAQSLALSRAASTPAGGAGIVTGFCTVLPERVTAETDGPPGALFLAQVFQSLGVDVVLIADRPAMPLLAAGARAQGLRAELIEMPLSADDAWCEQFFSAGPGSRLSHLIAIERPGPSHTLESLLAQPRRGPAPAERFLSQVPEADRNVCHTMRGVSIDAHTAPTHRLFETIARHSSQVSSIGIGDGGNELGLGRYLWEDLVEAIGPGPSARIACRTATEQTLIAGVSNWAGYALGLAMGKLRGADLNQHWLTAPGQQELVEILVRQGGAVDGRTLQSTVTVDGLEMPAYLAPLAEMRRLLGLSP